MGFVETFTDVEGRKSREDQSLNGTGEQAQQHHGQGNNQWHEIDEHTNREFIGEDISEKTEGKRWRHR